MALLRKYIWMLLILGMIFVSVAIGLIFLIINNCLSRKGKHRILQLQRRSNIRVESNKYNERYLDSEVPALPPRTQFVTAEAQSYENLAEDHDYEESMDQKPDYVKVEDETEILHPSPLYPAPDPKMNSSVSMGQSYENLAEEHDYEESTDQQSDYVKVEDETEILPPPPLYAGPVLKMNSDVSMGQSYENLAEEHDYEESTDQQSDYVKVEDEEILLPDPADPEADDASTEDYDDIGSEVEEDYDDVA